MVAITVKNIPAELYERVKERAKTNHRSINNELITILEAIFAASHPLT